MDSYEYSEYRMKLREDMSEHSKLTYNQRLNEYKKIIENYKNIKINYGTDEYEFLLDEMKKRCLCSENNNNLRFNLRLNGIEINKSKSIWSGIIIL